VPLFYPHIIEVKGPAPNQLARNPVQVSWQM
jgi:hypothetical protein